MYKIKHTTKFKRDLKKIMHKQNYKDEFKEVVSKLQNWEILEEKYQNHPLKWKYNWFMECHIKPDLLLIYRYNENENNIVFTKIMKP